MRNSVLKRGRKPLLEASSKSRGRRSGSIQKQQEVIEVTNCIKALMNGMNSCDEMPTCSSPLLGEPIYLSIDNGISTPSLILPGLELSIPHNYQTTHCDSPIKFYPISPFYSSSSVESEYISDEPFYKETTNLALNSPPSTVTLPDPIVKGCFLQFIDNLDFEPSVSPLNSYSDDQNKEAMVICDFLTSHSSSAAFNHNYNRNYHVPSYLVSSLKYPLGSCMEHEMHKGGFCSFKGSGLLEEIVCGYV